MRLQYQKLIPDEDSSFSVLEVEQPVFDAVWHYHPEVELTWIRRGVGERLVGDEIEEFGQDDLVLVGGGVPHFWRSGGGRRGGPVADLSGRWPASALVVQFDQGLFQGVDFRVLWDLLERAKTTGGLVFSRSETGEILRLFKGFSEVRGWRRFGLLVDVLGSLAELGETRELRGVPATLMKGSGEARLNRVLEWMMENVGDEVSLGAAAEVAGMTRSAFCRFFQRAVGRKFSEFLNGVRVARACELIRRYGDGMDLARVGFEAGFGTVSNFNRVFREVRGVTPGDWRRGGGFEKLKS